MPKNNQLDAELQAKRQELKALDEAIAERKRYHREQEKLITEMIETGNSKLMALIYDVKLSEQELRDIKTDIRTASQDKVILSRELAAMQLEASGAAGISAIPAFG